MCAIWVIWFASITKYSQWLTHVQLSVAAEGTSSANLVLIIAFCMTFDSKVTRSLETRKGLTSQLNNQWSYQLSSDISHCVKSVEFGAVLW